MIALLVPAVVAATLAGPAFAAVTRVARRRPFAPLVRGSLERTCVLVAAGIAAASTSRQVLALAAWACIDPDQLELRATSLFFLLLPPALGAAPWVAGELLSGPSLRAEESFAAALAAAYAGCAAAFGLALPAGVPVALALAAAAGTLLATFAYLRIRGGIFPETRALEIDGGGSCS